MELLPPEDDTSLHQPLRVATTPQLIDTRIRELAQESRELHLERYDLLRQVREGADLATLGYSHRGDFAREELGISASTWRNSVRLARSLDELPRAREALARGWICESRLLVVLPEMTRDNESLWLRRAIRWPVTRLRTLVRESKRLKKEAEDPDSPEPAGDLIRISLPAPIRTRLQFDAFTKEVSRRIGGPASRGRALELALGEFRSLVPTDVWSRVELRREWPPRFLAGASESGADAESKCEVDDRRFVCVGEGETQREILPDWLRRELESGGGVWDRRSEPSDVPGVPPEQTDGRQFVMSSAHRPTFHRFEVDDFGLGPLVSHYQAWILESRARYEEDRVTADDKRVARKLREFEAWEAGIGRGKAAAATATIAPTTEDAAARSPRALITRHREVVARLRQNRLAIAESLVLLDLQELHAIGWDSLEDYVGDSLDISIRTAYDWMAPLSTHGPFRPTSSAQADAAFRTRLASIHLGETALRLLDRLRSNGALRDSLELWISRAGETTVKTLEEQVEWTLAHAIYEPLHLRLRSKQPALAPPTWESWPWIRAQLLRRPELIADRSFHLTIWERPEEAGTSTPGLQISVTPPTDPPWSAPPDFLVPPPTAGTDTRIFLALDPNLLDEFLRATALLRGVYGEAQPLWWCLEVMILHVRNGWIAEDADFRRRTAQVDVLARDGFQCAAPVCTARRDLTVHHITFRSAGGDDDPANLISLCAACHLHGVHARGSIGVQRLPSGELSWRIGDVHYEGERRV